MVKETRLYDILGAEPNANDAELKTAYKKGALKLHPDKATTNPKQDPAEAAKQFQELSEAYQTLSDPRLRQIYDQQGQDGLTRAKTGGGGGGADPEDLMSNFFNGGGGLFSSMFRGGMREEGPKKARTIHHVHKVSLEDIYKGKVSKLALQKSVICTECDGRGGKVGAVKTCTGCNGVGTKLMMYQTGPMIQRVQAKCPDCDGEGEIIRPKDKCRKCVGKKTVIERKVLHVHVDKGVKNGHKIDFKGEGDQLPGVMPGDVQFEIEQKEHPRFQRRDDDLFYHCDIDLVTALAGGTIFIEHLDQRSLKVEIIPGEAISPGELKMVRGEGMPSLRHHDHGNLYVQFEVKFPPRHFNSDEQIAKLRDILPPALEVIEPENVDEKDLEDVDQSQQRRAQGATMEDDEEDGVPQGAERMQCATQ